MDVLIALFSAGAKPILIGLVAISSSVGLLALVSPKAFSRVVAMGSYSVDTHKWLRIPDWKLFRISDKWFDTDRYAIRYARLTGIAILAGVGILTSIVLLG